MLMQIGQKPESTFHEPIEMLEDCHKRFFFFLRNLTKVAAEGDAHSLDPGHRAVLEKALHYFRTSAVLHNTDEEQSLFPRLRKLENPTAGELLIQIDSLENDHRWADQQHSQVDAICRRWIETGTVAQDDRAQLKTILASLLTFYERHIKLEESEVFRAARALLSASGKESMGEEMAQRRNLTIDGRKMDGTQAAGCAADSGMAAAENRAAEERMTRQ